MDHEALIQLDLEQDGRGVLVSSPQFPLLHLMIEDDSNAEIEKRVLPVLKEMVEFKIGEAVSLRLVGPLDSRGPDERHLIVPPHVIASRIETHVG